MRGPAQARDPFAVDHVTPTETETPVSAPALAARPEGAVSAAEEGHDVAPPGLDVAREPGDTAARLATLGPRPLSVCVADVEPETVQWCWADRVPYGKIAVLDGDPGLGKSTITLDLAARLTTGSPLPGGPTPGRREPVSVLLLSAEDGVADTIRKRLEAAGADLTRVHVMDVVPAEDGGTRPLTLPDDLGAVEAEAARVEAGLLVVDPLMAFLSGDVNAHRDSDVRRVLHALKLFAEGSSVAVVVVRHLNKSGGANSLYRGGGSIGIIGAARAGLVVAPDPDDPGEERRVLAVTKSNLAAKPASLAYRLVGDTEHQCARVVWEGESDRGADDLLRGRDDDEHVSKVDACADALRALLEDSPGGVTPKHAAAYCADAGFSHRTYERARKLLGVVSVPPEAPGTKGATWRIELPAEPPGSPHVRQNPGVGGHGSPTRETRGVSAGDAMSAMAANPDAGPMSAKGVGGHGDGPDEGALFDPGETTDSGRRYRQ